MAFVKLVKNKAYFMRYQTKFKRRREGKTDYYARKRLISQDKDKYNTPKYRLVARITSTRIITQVIYATIQGDRVFCAADSYELKHFGVTAGLANYAAAYATGLLLATRLLKKVGLKAGQSAEERKPFKVILDVGLKATTTGSKVFAVMKGASDGGLNVPHSTNRLVGKVDKKGENKILRGRILGAHVDAYLAKLKGTPKENIQFSQIKKCLEAAKLPSLEKLYEKVHAEIRKNPDHVKKQQKTDPKRDHKKFHRVRLTAAQRKAAVDKKIEIRLKELKKNEKAAAKKK